MKNLIIISIIFLTTFTIKSNAQDSPSSEKYGSTLNLGAGVGYYGYIGHSIPAVHVNYEFDVAKNFTLAPFIAFYTYQNHYYWGNPNYPYRNYSYRETVIPVGVKGSYYFDSFLNAGDKWDFYLGASLGFNIRRTTWEDDYYGDKYAYQRRSSLYLDAHIGTEYHINQNIGLFLDLSSGNSTLGLALHF